jgi:DNA-binding response OmpR family regulator
MTPMTKKILLADDDASILEPIQMMLEDEGYQVDTTLSGEDLLHLGPDLPDLLLLDIWMAGISGRDICQHLKQQESTRQMPVIIVSANRDTEQIAREAGADDFLLKPFDIDDLLNKVQLHTTGEALEQDRS